MKNLFGNLIFEEIECWDCKGTKESHRNKLCPNSYKSTRRNGRTSCEHCGAKNKHSHKTIGEYTVPCTTCEAKGTRMETSHDNLPVEIYKNFQFEIAGEKYRTSFSDQYLGLGLVGGATDYGRMQKFAATHTPNEVINLIKNEYDGRQAIQFLKNGKLPNKIVISIGDGGYAVRPIWE